ncbi:MAG: tetratricopeptide repeat protein [Gammaproteobacteria bacterium]|nr:tetratricopeptide repeat protein [Gammaproteobacteria bacterium]
MKSGFLTTVSLVTLLCSNPIWADQADTRLDGLFAELHETTDKLRAAEVTQSIWSIWHEIADLQTTELMQEGIKAMQGRQYTEALEAFNQVVDLSPDYAEGWNKRATLYYLIGDYANSAKDVKQTLVLEPRHFGALSGLGLIYMELGNFDAALEAFQQTLEANPFASGAQQNIDYIKGTQPDIQL